MGDSPGIFRQHLLKELASGSVNKFDLHKKSGIARNVIDGYLEAASPNLRQLDRIAEALDCEPWELIRPSSKIPSDLLAAIERMDPGNYPQLLLIVNGFLAAESKPKPGSSDHQPRQKLK